MLYQVKLQYGFMVEAGSREDAFQKAIRELKDSPASHISDVRSTGVTDGKRPLWKRLVTGR
jgi:hypothetical protein